MDMTGEQLIPADRETVWKALNDPDVLRRCIPGCQELVKHSDTEMTAVAVIKVGPISARFQGAVVLSELDAPNGYRISGEGQGGVAGHAKGGAIVRLTPQGDATLLSYEVSAQVGGKLAQLGGRMIDATARTMSAAFFKKFASELEHGPEAVAAVTAPTSQQPSTQVRAPSFTGSPSHGQRNLLLGVFLGLLIGVLITTTGLGTIAAAALSPEVLTGLLFALVAVVAFLAGQSRRPN
jgi:carbon monoxide dehydrogenase subunit G